MWSISPKGIHKPHLYIGSQWTRSSKWSVVIVPIIPTHPVHFRTLQVLQNLILQKVPFSFVHMRSVNYPFVNLSNQRSSIDWVILVSLMQFKIDEHCSVVDPGFPRWRGRQPIILAIFPQNCMKLNKLSPKMARVPSTLSDPPTGIPTFYFRAAKE